VPMLFTSDYDNVRVFSDTGPQRFFLYIGLHDVRTVH